MDWNVLTERQKSLDRSIEACGISLDGSNSCLQNVMKAIGANSSEEAFVRSRITLRLRAQQLLSDTDSFIERTERNFLFNFISAIAPTKLRIDPPKESPRISR